MGGRYTQLLILAAALGASGCLIGWNEKAPPRPRRSHAAAQLDEVDAERGPRARFTLRVWADQDFRKLPRWRQRAARTLDAAGQFLGRAFAVELDTVIMVWERTGDSGDGPAAILEQLRAHDPGTDSDWVMAFTGALSRFSTSQHDIGFAETPGTHFVLRHIDDHTEADYLRRELADRPARQREAIIADRRRHKEVAVFLHEWAHTLGAVHDYARGQLMRPEYDHEATGFSPINLLIIRKMLRARREGIGDAERRAVFEGLVSDLQTRTWRGADDGGRQALIGYLMQSLQRTGDPDAAAPPTARPAPESAEDAERRQIARRQRGLSPHGERFGITPDREADYIARFERAFAALQAGNSEQCRHRVREALARYPGAPGLHALRCGADMVDKRIASARRACDAAIAAWDETVFAHMFLAQIDEAAGRLAPAIAHAERTIALDPSQAGAWQALGGMYQQTGRTGDLANLRARYLERFHRELKLP